MTVQVHRLYEGQEKALSTDHIPDPLPLKLPRTPSPEEVQNLRLHNRLSVEEVMELAGVSRATWYRYEREGGMPPSMYGWLSIVTNKRGLRAGGPDWEGWYLMGGKLYTPEDYFFTQGEIRGMRYMRQANHSYRKNNDRLKKRVEELEEQLAHHRPREVDAKLITAIDRAMDEYFSWHSKREASPQY